MPLYQGNMIKRASEELGEESSIQAVKITYDNRSGNAGGFTHEMYACPKHEKEIVEELGKSFDNISIDPTQISIDALPRLSKNHYECCVDYWPAEECGDIESSGEVLPAHNDSPHVEPDIYPGDVEPDVPMN